MEESRVRNALAVAIKDAAEHVIGFGIDAVGRYGGLRDGKRGRHPAVIRVAEAVLVPATAVGVDFLWFWTNAHGSPVPWVPGWVLTSAGVVMFFAPFLYGFVQMVDSVELSRDWMVRTVAGLAIGSAAATVAAIGCSNWAIKNHALEARGVEVTCTVVDSTKRTQQNPGEQAGSSTYYDNRIACPPGGPSTVVSGTRPEPGQRLRVLYDSEHRLPATLETRPARWSVVATAGSIALAVALVANLAGVCLWVRAPA